MDNTRFIRSSWILSLLWCCRFYSSLMYYYIQEYDAYQASHRRHSKAYIAFKRSIGMNSKHVLKRFMPNTHHFAFDLW